MSLKRNIAVVYEPIDSRTLSKKEKFHYLVTLMRKPRLSSDSTIIPRNSSISSSTSSKSVFTPGSSSSPSSTSSSSPSYSGSDFDSDYNSDYTSASDIDEDSDDEDTNEDACLPARVHTPTAQERLQEELRQLDTFWSFKSIPRAAPPAVSNCRSRTKLPTGTDSEMSPTYCGDVANRDTPPQVDPPCTSPSPNPSNTLTSDAAASIPESSDIIIWSPKEKIVANTNAFQGQRKDILTSSSTPRPTPALTDAHRDSMGKQNQQQLVGFAVLEPRDEKVQMSYHYLSSSPSPASPGKFAPDARIGVDNCAAPMSQKRPKQLACEKYLLPKEARCFSFNQAKWRKERERERERESEEGNCGGIPCGNCNPGRGV